MLRINKVKDRKAENKRKKLVKSGASKTEIAKVKDDLSSSLQYFFNKEFTQNDIPSYKKEYKNYLGEGVWNGELAKDMGFNRIVKASDFNDLYNSVNPETREQIAKNTGRGFIELVFNCPKDYSLLATLDDDVKNELNDTFDDAIKETMKLLNDEFNQGRVNNKNETVKLNGLAYATFVHTTSRPTSNDNSVVRPDFHLHAHNLLWTTSQSEDGQFRAMKEQQIFKNQIYLGTYFRSILAQKLIELGYEVEPHTEIETTKDDNGKEKTEKIQSFKVKQITNEQRAFFSKRKSDIEYLSKKYGVTSNLCKDNIAQNFKHKKEKFDVQELLGIWKEDADLIGIDKDFLKSLRTFNRATIHENILSDEDLIRKAVIKKDGKEQIYTTVLMRTLCEYAQYVPINPHQKLQQLLEDKLLIRTGKHTFKKTFPSNSKSFAEEDFYTRKNVSAKKDRQRFLGLYLYKNKSRLLQSELQHKAKEKELANGVQEIKINRTENADDLLKVKAIPVQQEYKTSPVKASSTAVLSSVNASIESLYASVEELMKRARNPKLSASELAILQDQIDKLRLQIEQLEKQKKNENKFIDK